VNSELLPLPVIVIFSGISVCGLGIALAAPLVLDFYQNQLGIEFGSSRSMVLKLIRAAGVVLFMGGIAALLINVL
jgi:hypothetical protein